MVSDENLDICRSRGSRMSDMLPEKMSLLGYVNLAGTISLADIDLAIDREVLERAASPPEQASCSGKTTSSHCTTISQLALVSKA